MSSDQGSRISVFNAIGLHEHFRETSPVRIDCVSKKYCLCCKLISYHAIMGSVASCRSRDPSVPIFESVSIFGKVTRRRIPRSFLHAGESCSVANDSDTELENDTFGKHKAQEIAHRLSICDNAKIRKVKVWLPSLNSMDQGSQMRSRGPVGILVNVTASCVRSQDWVCLR